LEKKGKGKNPMPKTPPQPRAATSLPVKTGVEERGKEKHKYGGKRQKIKFLSCAGQEGVRSVSRRPAEADKGLNGSKRTRGGLGIKRKRGLPHKGRERYY